MEREKTSGRKGIMISLAVITGVLCLISAVGLFIIRDSQIGIWRDLSAMLGGFAPVMALLIAVGTLGLAIYLMVRGLNGKKALLGLLFCLASGVALIFLLILYVVLAPLGQLWIFELVTKLIAAAAAILAALFLVPRISKLAPRIIACVVLACMAVLAVFHIQVNSIWFAPTVYAVEDEYQIVWYTSARSTGWVEINGQKYYDAQSGNIRSTEKVHKVTVPMEVLDEEKSYSIHSQSTLIHHGYFSLKGRHLSASYSFRPVDPSDGIQLHNISDTHDYPTGAIASASYWGDRLDFLILNGDIANSAETDREMLEVLDIASAITRGERPVVYARGNHETRGESAATAYKYAGCSDEGNFYYEIRLGPVWILLLDCAEDKEDGHREYGGMADYSAYRAEEDAWLDEVLENPEESYAASGVEYRLLVSHVPFNVTERPEPELYASWVQKVNGIGVDLALAGHTHECLFLEPNGQYEDQTTVSTYWTVIGSAQEDIGMGESNASHTYFTSTAVELQPDAVTAMFINQDAAVRDKVEIKR